MVANRRGYKRYEIVESAGDTVVGSRSFLVRLAGWHDVGVDDDILRLGGVGRVV